MSANDPLQTSLVGSCDLDFLDVIETSLSRRGAGLIGKVHEQPVAEIYHRADRGIDRDEPRNERHDLLLHNVLRHFGMLLALSQSLTRRI